jgi:CBS domain containing-hemolysin-like protein
MRTATAAKLEQMTNTDPAGSHAELPQPDPESAAADSGERSPESWIDRLKAVVGLRPSASIREDLADALATDAAAGFSPEERAMIANILRLRDVRVDDVMVPRADIEAVDIDVTLGELLASFEKSGHSRLPVYRETLDEPLGLVHIKDLMSYIIAAGLVVSEPETRGKRRPAERVDLKRVDLSRKLSSANLVRNILFVPPSMPVTALLANMQGTRMQMALVIDEYGGTDGLVSLEDIIEMVVGEIEDEHDGDDRPTIQPDGDGVFLADARADLADVSAALGIDFARAEEGEEVDTVGGLVVNHLGRVPVRGELVTIPEGVEFEILDADPRRIKRLRIHKKPVDAVRPETRRRKPSNDTPTAA